MTRQVVVSQGCEVGLSQALWPRRPDGSSLQTGSSLRAAPLSEPHPQPQGASQGDRVLLLACHSWRRPFLTWGHAPQSPAPSDHQGSQCTDTSTNASPNPDHPLEGGNLGLQG